MKKRTIDHTHLLVLSLLAGEDMNGYQMIMELARRSDHTYGWQVAHRRFFLFLAFVLTFKAGIFFVNITQAEPGRASRYRLSFLFCLFARAYSGYPFCQRFLN